MLLVTTADENTWGQGEEILFLGEWCLVSGREEALQGRRYRVLPYHWDDREKLRHDAQMLQTRYEQILPRLADRLNAIHGTEHDLQYWRLVAGAWLIWMLSIVWDRLECLNRAVAMGATWTYVYQGAELAPLDFNAMGAQAPRSDSWNYSLCHHLLAFFPAIRRQFLAEGSVALPQSQPLRQGHFFSFLKSVLRRLGRILRPDVVFVNLHAATPVQVRLQLALGQFPLILSAPPIPSFAPNPAMRRQLTVDCGNDDLGKAMSVALAESFPAVLLEGYDVARGVAKRAFPPSPRIIVTANAHANELFCLWAGEQEAPLVILQHGGHYGVDRVEMMEDHELAIADIYCSWGWRRKGYSHIAPMPAFKIEAACMGAAPTAARHGLLAIYDSAHRYPYRIYGVPIAGQRRHDNDRQLQLLAMLPPHLRAQLRLRCHPLEDGFGFRAALRGMGLSEQFDKSRDMMTAVKSARLCLVASNSTPFLEAMASGTPTLAHYCPDFAEERAEAGPFFDALRAVGIVHTDPNVCSAKIAAVWDDPQAWWESPEIVEAREVFLKQFAYHRPDYLAYWRSFLRQRMS